MNKTQILATYVEWIDQNVKPDVYVVATLKQRIFVNNFGSRYCILGTFDRYAAAYRQFICRLSKAVYGKRHWRRHKRLIPNAATLEGNGYRPNSSTSLSKKSISHLKATQSVGKEVHFHLNMMFRRPDHLSLEMFAALIKSIWLTSDWAWTDINIGQRTGDCVSYSCKEGPETILVGSLSF